MEEEFRVINEFPDYEINREGIVRRISDGFEPKYWQQPQKNRSPIYHINGKPRTLKRLVSDAFTKLPQLKSLDIIGYPNYGISESGKIWSYNRKRFLKFKKDKDGYFEVTLNNGTPSWFRVHRLVGFAYLQNPGNKPMINHKDGDKQNNHYSNLEWVDNRENVIHSIENGLQKIIRKNEVTNPEKIHEVCKLLEYGVKPLSKIEKITGVSAKIVSSIKMKESWSFISDSYAIDTTPTFKNLEKEEVEYVCEMLSKGKTLGYIANNLGCGTSTIHRIKKRETYTDVSDHYKWD